MTVFDDVTSKNIYATAVANEYTYSIVYKSSNGTNLGTSSVTHLYGTVHTVTPPNKAGYITPASQSVQWNATSKTITFIYTPAAVGSTSKSGTLYDSPYTTWDANMAIRNRTANSVQIWLDWNEHMAAYGINSYGQYCRMINHNDSNKWIADFCVVPCGEWGSAVNYQRSKNAGSGWITVPVNTTNQTSIPIEIYFYQQNYSGTDVTGANGLGGASFMWDVPIPAY